MKCIDCEKTFAEVEVHVKCSDNSRVCIACSDVRWPKTEALRIYRDTLNYRVSQAVQDLLVESEIQEVINKSLN